MKKALFLIITSALLVSSAFCRGKAEKSAGEAVTVTGTINWYGNAPVEFPGLVTKDGKVYTLRVEDNSGLTLKEITDCQGSLITVTAVLDESMPGGFEVLKDGVLLVKSYKKAGKE